MKGAVKMWYAMIIIAIIAAILAALSVRLYAGLHEWQALANELQEENDALRTDTGTLCKEKITLSELLDEAEADKQHLTNLLDDAITAKENAEKELITAHTALNDIKREQAKPTAGAEMLLPPDMHTNTFRCEDYRLFDKRSQQAQLQTMCETGDETGIRIYTDSTGRGYYCAALGGAFGIEIGTGYAVTLRNGTTFNIILADYKHPIDSVNPYDFGDNDTNYDGDECICVIEFVVDMDNVPARVKQAGTMSALPQFGGLFGYGGDIVKIEKIGRVWEP